MQELRDRLAAAKQYADNHLQHEQSRWVNRYNLRSRDKQFAEGESVMILTPDSTSSRLWSRWRAPAKIISKQSDYSYLVEYNGSRLVMHANKLRPYKVRVDAVHCNSLMFVNESECVDTGVNTCSVIYDEDVDFGPVKVIEPSTHKEPLPSTKIDPARLAHLTEQQRIELLAVLDKYPQVFSETPGYCGQVVHQIIVSDNFKPKRCKPYRIPEKLKPEVDRQIQELEKLGFIEKSNTPMTSPLVCLIKKDKSVRCVVDYRYVNLYTLPNALGPPDVSSIIQKIGSAKYITTFDGKSSYWTIPVEEKHRWLTGFTTGEQVYVWTRAPFGLRNSGASFVRMLQSVLAPVKDFAASFVDDLAVYSNTWEQHLKHIDKTLHEISKCGLTLTIKKSEFAKPQVKFCGQIVGSGKREPDSEKLQAIKLLKEPETKTQLRQTLGLFGWFREHIPRYAEVALPLTELTSKRVPNRIPWGAREREAFNELKRLLCEEAEPLEIIDWSIPFIIRSDASNHSVAGVLAQKSTKGERPIAFYSKKLSGPQKMWATIEKEAFAVLEALRRFRSWVFGYEIHLYSDHNPLAYLTEAAPKSAKLMRWSLALQSYNVHFHYKAGNSSAMAVPDSLSRLGSDDCGVMPSTE